MDTVLKFCIGNVNRSANSKLNKKSAYNSIVLVELKSPSISKFCPIQKNYKFEIVEPARLHLSYFSFGYCVSESALVLVNLLSYAMFSAVSF